MDLTQFNAWFSSAAVYVNELPLVSGVALLDATGTRLEVPAVYPVGPAFGPNATVSGRVWSDANATMVDQLPRGRAVYTGSVAIGEGLAVVLVFAAYEAQLHGAVAGIIELYTNITFTRTSDACVIHAATASNTTTQSSPRATGGRPASTAATGRRT